MTRRAVMLRSAIVVALVIAVLVGFLIVASGEGDLTQPAIAFGTIIYALAAVATLGVVWWAATVALQQLEEVAATDSLSCSSGGISDSRLEESRIAAALFDRDELRERIDGLWSNRHDDESAVSEMSRLSRVPTFFEEVAMWEKRHALSFDLICDWNGSLVMNTWNHWAPAVNSQREVRGNPALCTNFEQLAHRIKEARGELKTSLAGSFE